MEKHTEQLRKQFRSVALSAIDRTGIVALMEWIEGTDFFTAPASTRFHGSHEGGLVEHSLAVYYRLHDLIELHDEGYIYWANESEAWSEESIAIVALFHDVCKIGTYKTDMRWRKDANNKWEQYPTYKKEEDFNFGGHGSKSLYLIQNFMSLRPEEAVAINCHMGQWDSTIYSNPSAAYEQYPLAWLLHVADEAATYIDHK